MINQKKHIVFLCTDNVGRSVIAEYCLQDYLRHHKIDNIFVSSAGIDADSDTSGFSMAHIGELEKLGIDASGHVRKQLDQAVVDSSDLIVCMDQYHQEWLEEHFGLNAPLFNEIYKHETSPIKVHEPGDKHDLDNRMRQITHYIHDAMPEFVENLGK